MFYKLFGVSKESDTQQVFLKADSIQHALAMAYQNTYGYYWRVERMYESGPTLASLAEEYTEYMHSSAEHTGVWRGCERIVSWLTALATKKGLLTKAAIQKELLQFMLEEAIDQSLVEYVKERLLVLGYFMQQLEYVDGK